METFESDDVLTTTMRKKCSFNWTGLLLRLCSNEKMACVYQKLHRCKVINCPFLFVCYFMFQISISCKDREIEELTTELMVTSTVTVVADLSSVAMTTSTVDSHQETERSTASITQARFEQIFSFQVPPLWKWIHLNSIGSLYFEFYKRSMDMFSLSFMY